MKRKKQIVVVSPRRISLGIMRSGLLAQADELSVLKHELEQERRNQYEFMNQLRTQVLKFDALPPNVKIGELDRVRSDIVKFLSTVLDVVRTREPATKEFEKAKNPDSPMHT